MITVLWVALGGSLGAVARYGGNVLTRALLPDHSWFIATFSINLLVPAALVPCTYCWNVN